MLGRGKRDKMIGLVPCFRDWSQFEWPQFSEQGSCQLITSLT